MRRLSILLTVLFAIALFFDAGSMSACGGTSSKSGFGSSGGSGGSGGGSGSSSGITSFGDGGYSSSGGSGDGGVVCPAGLQCNVQCNGGGSTTISGTVYDPAARNPLYNVAVYVPAAPLEPLPKGVLTGADACSCSALFKSGAVVSTSTKVDGTFVLENAPVGSAVPLVVQVGKWRKVYTIDVQPCTANAQSQKLLMPNSVAPNSDDNMPDIAVSTGSADTLECLMTRIGLPPTEYVAGTGTTGHVHVYSGGNPNGGIGGSPEAPAMPGAPESDTNLWPDQAHLMPYDILLLSCEGDETYNANPQALEAYLNAGGRAFASHFHYAWFAGPLTSGQTYTTNADWGTNLATWAGDEVDPDGPIGGTIIQTLNGSTQPFPKGVILDQWLGLVGALGKNIPVATDLSIYSPRYNAGVTAANVHSQPWIQGDPAASGPAKATEYFSFDTPVDAPNAPDGGPPTYCGRAVFSDLHVAGDPTTTDNPPPPGGCDNGPLSPQEKALEFMLFDLSSCVIPDTVAPPDGGTIIQ